MDSQRDVFSVTAHFNRQTDFTNGGELLGEIGLAIEMGCDAEDIALTIHAHPTLHESVGLAAEVFEGSITDLPNAKAKKK